MQLGKLAGISKAIYVPNATFMIQSKIGGAITIYAHNKLEVKAEECCFVETNLALSNRPTSWLVGSSQRPASQAVQLCGDTQCDQCALTLSNKSIEVEIGKSRTSSLPMEAPLVYRFYNENEKIAQRVRVQTKRTDVDNIKDVQTGCSIVSIQSLDDPFKVTSQLYE